VLLLLSLLVAMPRAAHGADAEPSVTASKTTVSPGETIVATLDGWPAGLVTVSVCGNAARRGSPDCDLNSSAAVAVVTGASSAMNLTIGVPAVPCPCVLRASTRLNDVVRTTPIEIAGVPVVGVADPEEPLTIHVRFRPTTGESMLDRARAVLGGPTKRVLVVTLRNNTASAMASLSLAAVVGRSPDDGEAVTAPVIQPLAPGEEHTYELPVTLPAPTWGTYKAYGTVYGLAAPAGFTATTSTYPWALFVAAAFVIIDVIAWRVLRRRKRRPARTALRDAEQQRMTRQTQDEQTWEAFPASEKSHLTSH
jgi:hypothetical protein